MDNLFLGLRIEVNKNLYIKDPESSDLGKKIVGDSILLINEIGFDHFTFKKLGNKINSNESSIYRYFENKHKLLLYLTTWYWAWKEYQLVFKTQNLQAPKLKLQTAINILTRSIEKDNLTSHIDEVQLNKLVINEFSKSILTKDVDKEYNEGYFEVYNRLIFRLKEMILMVDKEYDFSASLASTIVEGALHQYFLRDHFPVLTNCNKELSPSKYFNHLVFSTLNFREND